MTSATPRSAPTAGGPYSRRSRPGTSPAGRLPAAAPYRGAMRGRWTWVARAVEAALLVAFGLFGVHAELSATSFSRPPAALAYALTVAAGAVLVLRRRFPATI